MRRYGWKRNRLDFRDRKFKLRRELTGPRPIVVDLSFYCPPVWDQGTEGSCTGHGSVGGVLTMESIQGAKIAPDGSKSLLPAPPVMLSRNYVYYFARELIGCEDQDSGAEIRDCAKVISRGVPPEELWPYNSDTLFRRPPDDVVAAAKEKVISYEFLEQDNLLDTLRDCLAAGIVVVFGFMVYASFESSEVARTGIVPMPSAGEKAIGGHCVLAVGYNDHEQVAICRNSWGSDWGQDGYFKIPYQYLNNADLASDFCAIQLVS